MSSTLTPENRRALIAAAKTVSKKAYAPYSRFRVGAALLTSDGEIYTGCNVENSSYGLTICAERAAIFKAVSEGKTDFIALALHTNAPEHIPPCGACRQVLHEFSKDIPLVITNRQNRVKTYRLSRLLPLPFGPENLRKSRS